MATLSKLSKLCCLCCDCNDDEDRHSTHSSLTPLLARDESLSPLSPLSLPSPAMPPIKTYGKRSAAAPGAAAIFGAAAEPRSPLADLTSAITNLSLQPEKEEEEYTLEAASIIKPHASLLPLINAYKTDLNRLLLVQDWNDVLDDDADIIKIAEASYAEVYRVNTSIGSSILKVMQIKLPEVPESLQFETAVDITTLISEIRIMNVLTTVPGFVTFKDAHLVQGMIPRCIHKAYRAHRKELKRDGKESYFPPPKHYTDDTIFLAVELGDAGEVLEDFKIDTVDKLWDVFIGTTIALARAEVTNEFEHRDLHENNICVKYGPIRSFAEELAVDSHLKYGFSGLEITIIDYGLSRTTLTYGDVAFNDLEQDLDLFHSEDKGIAGIQYDTYRRMRTHLLTGTRSMWQSNHHTKESFQEDANPKRFGWSDYIPYTNVLWLRYLLTMLIGKLKVDAAGPMLAKNLDAEIKPLKKGFDFRTKVENGAFSTAQDVLLWMIEQGWVTNDQIAGGDGTTFLSEA